MGFFTTGYPTGFVIGIIIMVMVGILKLKGDRVQKRLREKNGS